MARWPIQALRVIHRHGRMRPGDGIVLVVTASSHRVAAFEAHGYRPRDEEIYVLHSVPGRMLARFALHDDRTLFLFVFVAGAGSDPDAHDLAGQKALLRARFGGAKWECARILAALDGAADLYFDRVSQIRMERW